MNKGRYFIVGGISVIAATLIFAFGGLLMTGPPATSETNGQTGLLAGRNVNMVSGTRLPWGDPWLQRQNEPSLAASSRNPMHLLAGANDYRTVDIPDDFKVPGIPPQAAARDAWLGLFKSFDGGQSWITTLLPGYPQDSTTEGLASPIHGFEAACDPCVRAGSNGMFYYSGIAFNRSGGSGAVFLARYIDNNNLEEIKKTVVDNPGEINDNWQWVVEDDPIKYVSTRIIDTGNPGQFIDMPTVAADIPRSVSAGTTMIKGQAIPNANVYMAYTVFLGNSDINVRSRLMFIRSANCGESWGSPIKLTEGQHIIQRPVITIDPRDPTGNTLYVAFRRFAHGTMPGGIVICKSLDGGRTFTKPIDVETLLYPFDQGMDASKFRTNSYPAMAVDGNGIVYVAWPQRMGGPNAQSRIVMKTSADGIVWSGPVMAVELTGEDGQALKGNQFMPSLTFAAGRILLAWYDQRGTISPDNGSGAVMDISPNRQTIDVRAAEILPGLTPVFGRSYQVSRYLYYLALDDDGNPIEESGYFLAVQAEYNPPNLPLFQLGTRPFLGDYIDITAAPYILPPAATGGAWAFNTSLIGHPVTFHSAWADERDVSPPADGWWGSWSDYSPPSSPQDGIFSHTGPCNVSATGMRNQNVYTASLGKGVFVGSPGNNKQLDLAETLDGGRRTFVVVVKNLTDLEKTFDLNIQELGNVEASFTQSGDTDTLSDVLVAPYSSYSCTVYVDDANGNILPVKVEVFENGALVGYALLNPDPTSLPVDDPAGENNYGWYEEHNPRVQNPRVHNYDLGNKNEPNPRVMNPRVQNPRVMNPRVMNPRVMNPRVQNPRVMNPRVQNDSIVNQEVANPRVQNPRVQNTALTDVTWVVSNEGNTTSAYTFDIVSTVDQYFSGDDPPLIGQILVYKLHRVPGAYTCELAETHEDELLVNIANPRVQNPRVMNNVPDEAQATTAQTMAENGNEELPQDVTFWLAPGEEAYVTFRVWDDDTTDDIDFDAQTVTAYVEAEAINTGETAPEFALPDDGVPWETPMPEVGVNPPSLTFYALSGSPPAGQQLTVWNAGGGSLSYSVQEDTSWLSITPAAGQSTGSGDEQIHTLSVDVTGLAAGTYTADVAIIDPFASNNPLRIDVTLTIYDTAPVLSIATASIPDAIKGTAYSAYLESAGGVGDVTWSVSAGSLPPGLALENTEGGTGWILGTPTAAGYFNFTVQAQTALQSVTQPLSMTVADWVARYNGPANGGDSIVEWASAVVAVDASGNLYVTGRSPGSGTGPIDCVTLKYSSAGVEQWAARYNGPANGADEGKAIAVDSMGYVYITGRSTGSGGDDYATIKYASDGTLQWVASYNGPVNGSDSGVTIAVDSTGNVYVTGYSPGSGTGYDFATVKYDSAGVEQWAARYNGTASGFDMGRAIAVDPSGNVYVTGRSTETGSGDDYATIKYAGNGVQQWVAHYNGPGNALDSATAIAVDPSGNVYVTGTSAGNGTSADFATIKYSSAGSEQWVRRYNGPADGMDDGVAIAVDPSGNVYVTGPSAAIGTDSDYATIKYDGSGAPQWVARYNGPGAPGNNEDSATDIILDPLGNVYVTGESVGSGGDLDFATVKYDGAGAMQWAARYDHTEDNTDACRALAMDPLGNICVAGISYDSASNYDIASVRYVQSFPSTLLIATEAMDVGYINTQYAKTLWAFGGSGGTRTWSLVGGSLPPGMDLSAVTGRIAGTPNTAGTYVFTVQVVADGVLTATKALSIIVQDAYEFLAKWGASGNGNGQFVRPYGLALDSSGYIYVAEVGNDRVQRFTSDGTYVSQWGTEGTGNGQFNSPLGIAVDSAGYVYVSDNNNHRIQKFTAAGVYVSQWGTLGSGPGQLNYPAYLAIDSSGYVYVADTSNHRVQKFTSTGGYVTQWGSVGSGNGQFSYPSGIALDSSGYVYVGEYGNDRIQKFTSDGTYVSQWGSLGTGNGQFNGPEVIAVDSEGAIFVLDSSNHRVQKFTSTGDFVTLWGTYGTGDGQFIYPKGLCVDVSGHIYVADSWNDRIEVFRKR
jgi:uncharacterized delta-60 repeat protein